MIIFYSAYCLIIIIINTFLTCGTNKGYLISSYLILEKVIYVIAEGFFCFWVRKFTGTCSLKARAKMGVQVA